MYVDDLADAVFFLMNNYDAKDIGEFVNIGTGTDLTIKELAERAERIGFGGIGIYKNHLHVDVGPRRRW